MFASGWGGDFGVRVEQVVKGYDGLHDGPAIDLAGREHAPADIVDSVVVPIGVVGVWLAVGAREHDVRSVHVGFGT